MTKTVGERLGAAIGSALEESERVEREEAPRRARLEKLRQATPRVVYRDDGRGWYGGGHATYHSLRMTDVRWMPARTETLHLFGSSKAETRRRAAHVTISRGGSQVAISPERLGEFVRRPTAKALRRLEEAEEALRQARLAVRDAERAAFTYGKPVTISAVQDVTRRHKAAWNGEE